VEKNKQNNPLLTVCYVYVHNKKQINYLDGPLPKLCPVIPTSNQVATKLKIEKRGMKF
jgi:hypothetical protein